MPHLCFNLWIVAYFPTKQTAGTAQGLVVLLPGDGFRLRRALPGLGPLGGTFNKGCW